MIDRQRGLLPDEFAEYYMDRVMNVGSNSCVTFGLTGTVTGILWVVNQLRKVSDF